MKQEIKLGDKIRLLTNVKQTTAFGDELFIKGSIGIVCDADNPNCPIVEIENSLGELTVTGFLIKDLEIIK